MIVKPLDGHGGESVFLASADDRNLNAILEAVTRFESRPIMAQRYLSEIRDGDKRLIVLDGEPLGCTLRVPRDDENRGNIHVGGNCVKAEITARDREICSMMRPRLKRDGLYFVGLDIIGNYLTEVNVTSPTGIQEIDRLDGANLEAKVIDFVESRVIAPSLSAANAGAGTGLTAVARGRRDRYELRPPERPDPCSSGGQVAQSVEQKTENLRVECSIHSLPTKNPLTIELFTYAEETRRVAGNGASTGRNPWIVVSVWYRGHRMRISSSTEPPAIDMLSDDSRGAIGLVCIVVMGALGIREVKTIFFDGRSLESLAC